MILVTGGTGLVGSQLLLDLALKGENIRALRRENSSLAVVKKIFSSYSILFEKIEWMVGDITDIFSLQEALKGIDEVYHCAAIVSFDPGDTQKMLDININGTANVVNICLENKIRKLCYVSSVAAINRISEEEIINENSHWKISDQNSNYSISKYGAEREVWRGIAEGLNAVIVNPTIILGPGNWQTGSAAMFNQVWKGLKFYTEGTSGFIDVKDVTRTMIYLMESDVASERFIVNAENLEFRKIFDWIAEGLGKPKPSIFINSFLRGIAWRIERIKKFVYKTTPLITKETALSAGKKITFSNEKIKKIINFEFISIEQSVKNTCKLFLEEVNVKN